MSKVLPLLLLSILLFPLAEIAASIWLFHLIGWWLIVWFVGAGWFGLAILRNWRVTAAWAIIGAARAGELPFTRLLYALRTMIAAILFVLPGPIGDCIGLLLMLPWPGTKTTPASVNDGVLEGEFVEIKPESRQLDDRP